MDKTEQGGLWACKCGYMASRAFGKCGRCGAPPPQETLDDIFACYRQLTPDVQRRICNLFATLRAERDTAIAERDEAKSALQDYAMKLLKSYGIGA